MQDFMGPLSSSSCPFLRPMDSRRLLARAWEITISAFLKKSTLILRQAI